MFIFFSTLYQQCPLSFPSHAYTYNRKIVNLSMTIGNIITVCPTATTKRGNQAKYCNCLETKDLSRVCVLAMPKKGVKYTWNIVLSQFFAVFAFVLCFFFSPRFFNVDLTFFRHFVKRGKKKLWRYLNVNFLFIVVSRLFFRHPLACCALFVCECRFCYKRTFWQIDQLLSLVMCGWKWDGAFVVASMIIRRHISW